MKKLSFVTMASIALSVAGESGKFAGSYSISPLMDL